MKIDPSESRKNAKRFYISDFHLGHKAIIKIDKRPFSTYDEMYDTIIKNWNSVVSDDDTVYILGDLSFNSDVALGIVKQLKGHKILILGNHDALKSDLRAQFDKIEYYYETVDKLDGRSVRVIMSHYPIAHWNNQFHSAVCVYGHTHDNADDKLFQKYLQTVHNELGVDALALNCGCMKSYMNYTPRTLQEMKDLRLISD